MELSQLPVAEDIRSTTSSFDANLNDHFYRGIDHKIRNNKQMLLSKQRKMGKDKGQTSKQFQVQGLAFYTFSESFISRGLTVSQWETYTSVHQLILTKLQEHVGKLLIGVTLILI